MSSIPTGRRLCVVIAPDKFKGSLTAAAAAEAMAAGVRDVHPDAEVVQRPIADGGEGTVAALVESGASSETARVTDPLGRPVEAVYAVLDGTAYLETAHACGLGYIAAPDGRSARSATTYGVGELVRAAADSGARTIVVGLGGSGTNDGGAGLLAALGATADRPLDEGAAGLAGITTVELPALRDAGVALVAASDVDNPLTGLFGATKVFGPQKGVAEERLPVLDGWLEELAAATDKRVSLEKGAGAAGGLGFALLLLGATRSPGIDLVAGAVRLAERARIADLVLTGEGRVDEQTAYGKTALGVAKRAAAARTPCLVFGGGVTPDGAAALADLGAIAIPVVESPQSIEEAMSAGPGPLERAGERIDEALDAIGRGRPPA
jgi:glycerate kinase